MNSLKIGSYRPVKDALIAMYVQHGSFRATQLSITIGVPLIAFYTFLIEVGETSFEKKLERLKEFYGIDKVIE